MPAFRPSILISDAYGSVGDVTFYHRNGKCFYKKKPAGYYPGTDAQLAALDIHRRALNAWKSLDWNTQKVWNMYAEDVVPHKPPFNGEARISGQNLFVSAYHGFATLGDEHTPEPQRLVKFPPFAAELGDFSSSDGILTIPAVVTIAEELDAGRYRLLAKLQLTKPGKGRNSGLMRNYLADRNCGSGPVTIQIPDYVTVCGLDLDEYQVHAKFILLDTVTGYRSQAQPYSTIVKSS